MKKIIFWGWGLVLVAVLVPGSAGAFVSVERVIDGDTLVVVLPGGVVERVRLLGIDAPEVRPEECFNQAASERLRELVGGGEVVLRADDLNDDRDKFGRLLRYVFVAGVNVNQSLVTEGYARAYLEYDFEFKELFAELESEARLGQLGLWSPDVCAPAVARSVGADGVLRWWFGLVGWLVLAVALFGVWFKWWR